MRTGCGCIRMTAALQLFCILLMLKTVILLLPVSTGFYLVFALIQSMGIHRSCSYIHQSHAVGTTTGCATRKAAGDPSSDGIRQS